MTYIFKFPFMLTLFQDCNPKQISGWG